jgi:hypothetical protein
VSARINHRPDNRSYPYRKYYLVIQKSQEEERPDRDV